MQITLPRSTKPFSKQIPHLYIFMSAWFLLLICSAAAADDLGFEPVKFSGFATLGITKGGDEIFGYRREISREGVYDGDYTLETDSLLGLQVDVRFSSQLDAAIQAIAKDRAKNGVEESIEWAYLRYRPNPGITVRAGRIGMDLYMLSEYRSLGIAYLWARPPVEFYGPISLDYFEGADLTYSTPLGRGTLRVKVGGGRSENEIVVSGASSNFKLNNFYALNVDWESTHWHLKFATSTSDIDRSLGESYSADLLIETLQLAYLNGWTEAPAVAEGIEVNGQSIIYHSLGLAYDNTPWVIQSEVSYYDSNYDILKSYAGRYLSVGYKINSTTVYGLLAKGKATDRREDVPDPPAPLVPVFGPVHQVIQSIYDVNYIDQQSISLGFRWDIRYNLALKGQIDRTWVEAGGGALFETKDFSLDEDRQLNTYSINLNYVF